MTDFAPSFAYRLGGSLNLADNPEDLDEAQAVELVNVRFPGLGAWAPRFAAAALEGGFSNLCGIHEMPHGADTSGGAANGVVYLDFAGGAVQLYAADGKGRNKALVGTLAGWSAVGARPKTLAAVLNQCLWIVDETKLYGLTVYDPEEVFGQGKLWQPSFKFEPGLSTPASVILARAVAAYNNILFVAGMGSEADPDRPEIVRFSYLGFEPDNQGAGDAGKDGAPIFGDAGYDAAAEISPGSAGLFDIDDYFFIGPRGQPVVSMVPAAERLLMLTRFAAHLLFGYDRFSFQADILDNQRGVVAGRAAGQANGVAYWWSPLGPTRWAGGRVEGLERLITPRIRQVNNDTMFFAHQPEEYEARFYYALDTGDPNRAMCFNYLYDRFKEEELGFRAFCGGSARAGTILRPGPGGDPIPDPGETVDPNLTPPSGVTHTEITPNTATARWVNGETGPTIKTRVYRTLVSSGVEVLVGEVASGVQQLAYAGLVADSQYSTEVEHFDQTTGLVSARSAPGLFTTSAQGTLAAPTNFLMLPFLYFEPNTGLPLLRVVWSWNLGQAAVYTQVELRRQGQATPFAAATYRTALNATSVQEPLFPQTGIWVARARHTSTQDYDEVLAPVGQASPWSVELTFDAGLWMQQNGV